MRYNLLFRLPRRRHRTPGPRTAHGRFQSQTFEGRTACNGHKLQAWAIKRRAKDLEFEKFSQGRDYKDLKPPDTRLIACNFRCLSC
jgi:hypothetical protein